MRLADFCNPHFKDEHPSQAWLPALQALENRVISRHSIRFARLTLAAGRALNHNRRESVEALTSVSATGASAVHQPRQPKTASTASP
jgi:hypothetical protein